MCMAVIISLINFGIMSTKNIHYLIAVIFITFAALQYNDPDPLLWMLIYGVVTLVAVLKVYLRQLNFKPLVTTFMVIFALYSLMYVPVFVEFLGNPDKSELFGAMKVTKSWIEGTREFLGLLIAIGALEYLRRSKVKGK